MVAADNLDVLTNFLQAGGCNSQGATCLLADASGLQISHTLRADVVSACCPESCTHACARQIANRLWLAEPRPVEACHTGQLAVPRRTFLGCACLVHPGLLLAQVGGDRNGLGGQTRLPPLRSSNVSRGPGEWTVFAPVVCSLRTVQTK